MHIHFHFEKIWRMNCFVFILNIYFVKLIVAPSMKIMPLRKTLPESGSLNSSFIVSLKLEVKEPDSGSLRYIYIWNSKESKIILNLSFLSWKSWKLWRCFYVERISETFTSSTKTSSKICYWKCYFRRIEGFLTNVSWISLEMVEGWRDPQVAPSIEPFPERTLAPAFLVGEPYPQGLPDQESKGTS